MSFGIEPSTCSIITMYQTKGRFECHSESIPLKMTLNQPITSEGFKRERESNPMMMPVIKHNRVRIQTRLEPITACQNPFLAAQVEEVVAAGSP